jgi:hypothetical protein
MVAKQQRDYCTAELAKPLGENKPARVDEAE